MSKSEQKLKKIEIQQLKGLKNITIDLSESPLVAILGANGVGKSTILHSLACINSPVESPRTTINHKLSEFFTPTTHSIWTGSSFNVYQSFRDGAVTTNNHITNFRKEQDRWAPRYITRIERYVSYIGIRTCVPIIESETQQSRIQFNTTPLIDFNSTKIREFAGFIMNKEYTAFNSHKSGSRKTYIGVTCDGVNYSSLSMGAGEQRIFYMLSEVLKAPSHGMIIIDEIEVLLHQDALIRLTNVLNQLAIEKKLQIIFTTHAQALLQLNYIAVRHLLQTPEKTLCFTTTKPDALQRLTGIQERPLEFFVEDDLAYCIVKKISSEEGLSKYVSIKLYGAATNCFTAVCGAILNNLDNQNNILFILDGDLYQSNEEKKRQINKCLTGTTHANDEQRQLAMNMITQFIIPEETKPEIYYHHLICQLNKNDLNQEQIEVITVAKEIGNSGNSHMYLNDIITRMDWSREVGLSKLIDLLSLSTEWDSIKLNIKTWILARSNNLLEHN